jgi:dipeptidyl aminopeptidase/acylaminoacyl peptidase
MNFKYILYLLFALGLQTQLVAQQKKILTHSVYDSWETVQEPKISNTYVDSLGSCLAACLINVQEGDGRAIISTNDKILKEIPRGYDISLSHDGQFAFGRIRPYYAETKKARIAKKKPEEMPKDSFFVYNSLRDTFWKTDKVRSYKYAEKQKLNYVVVFTDKPKDTGKVKSTAPPTAGQLWLLNNGAANKQWPNVLEYIQSQDGTKLLIKAAGINAKTTHIILYNINTSKTDTIERNVVDAKGLVLSEDGSQLAYLSSYDSTAQKSYALMYAQAGASQSKLLLTKGSENMPAIMQVSENQLPYFSKQGKRLFFGINPPITPRDTSLAELDRVSLDIWHWQDEQIMPQQLRQADARQKESYLCYITTANINDMATAFVQLTNDSMRRVQLTAQGDGQVAYGQTSSLYNKIENQWNLLPASNYYAVNMETGKPKLIKKNAKLILYPSYSGNKLAWYNFENQQYFSYIGETEKNITSTIPFKLYDEDNDMPGPLQNYGAPGWTKAEDYFLLYDRYDMWATGSAKAINFTKGIGRKNKSQLRLVILDREANEKGIDIDKIYLAGNNEINKNNLLYTLNSSNGNVTQLMDYAGSLGQVIKSKSADHFVHVKSAWNQMPTFCYSNNNLQSSQTIITSNPQQKEYNWYKPQLVKWTAFNGKPSEGILYTPENLDPSKKYPLIVYFYEKMSDNLNLYFAPSPSASSINVAMFTSQGYCVFYPDISYGTGHPGNDAYNYIVSGTNAVVKKFKFIDSTRMGLQGQSWGGYQTAIVITKTNKYKAAWAGAPVANMTSAYGGIRWGAGISRQFQYEQSQSRLGATPWDKPALYLENSPLFHLNKVKTPLVIMANDNDGAVPWYQGIELFSGLRRLNKPVWMLNYNNEDHNLVERKNRKDISIRLQQFFDWQLKDQAPAEWLLKGLPAAQKGKTMALEEE